MSLSATCLNDKFSLDGESITFECVKLLSSLIFEPKLDENGNFFDEDIEAEKRILIEKINSEENEKRIYVLRKTEEKCFQMSLILLTNTDMLKMLKRFQKRYQNCLG